MGGGSVHGAKTLNDGRVIPANRLETVGGFALGQYYIVMSDKHFGNLTENERSDIIYSVGRSKFLFRRSGAH